MALTAAEQAILEQLEDPDAESPSSYKWDEEFQRHILGMLLNSQYFLVQSMGLVKPTYFTDEVHRMVCSILFSHFDTYRVLPNRTFLRTEIKTKLENNKKDEVIIDHFLIELDSVLSYYTPGVDNREYLLDKLTNFAKIEALKIAFNVSLAKLKNQPDEEGTWSEVYDLLQKAMQVNHDVDTGLEYFQTFEDRYNDMTNDDIVKERFTSGFPKGIDEKLVNGGPARKELYSWMGLSGAGKSLALVAGACANVSLGKKVLYVSLEMDETMIAERFDAQLANVGINNLADRKDMVFAALREIVEENENDPKLLVIKQFPPGEMGLDQLRSYYTQLALTGFRPDLVIVDYVGEMKDLPNMKTWESRYRLVRGLRGFAVQENICIFTAMQPNKSAREAQKVGVIDDENLADAFGQIRPLDGCWSINQVQDEKDCGVARIFVVKHRHGKSRYPFWIENNPETLKMTEISQEQYKRRLSAYQNEKKVYASDQAGDQLDSNAPDYRREYLNQEKLSPGGDDTQEGDVDETQGD